MTTKYVFNYAVYDDYSDACGAFEEYLNEDGMTFSMNLGAHGVLSWPAGTVLKRVDPIAFGAVASDSIEEQDWELVADDILGYRHQVNRALDVMRSEFPTEFAQLVEDESLAFSDDGELVGEDDDIDFSSIVYQIERLTDSAIRWEEGLVWHVS